MQSCLPLRVGAGGFDQVPEFRVLLKCFVFADGEAGAEKKILEGVFAEDSVDDESEVVPFKVNSIITDSEPVQGASFPFQLSEPFQFGGHDFLGEPAEFAEDGELQFLWHLGQFCCARGIEDDLEWPHDERLVARTGVEPVFRP